MFRLLDLWLSGLDNSIYTCCGGNTESVPCPITRRGTLLKIILRFTIIIMDHVALDKLKLRIGIHWVDECRSGIEYVCEMTWCIYTIGEQITKIAIAVIYFWVVQKVSSDRNHQQLYIYNEIFIWKRKTNFVSYGSDNMWVKLIIFSALLIQ